MSKIKKTRGLPFTQMNNKVINMKELSLAAKGLYIFMYSKPDGWNFTIMSMSHQLKEGQRAITTALNELLEVGLIQRVRHSLKNQEYLLNWEVPDKNLLSSPLNTPSLRNVNCGTVKFTKRQRISNKENLERKMAAKEKSKSAESGGLPPLPPRADFSAAAEGKSSYISPPSSSKLAEFKAYYKDVELSYGTDARFSKLSETVQQQCIDYLALIPRGNELPYSASVINTVMADDYEPKIIYTKQWS